MSMDASLPVCYGGSFMHHGATRRIGYTSDRHHAYVAGPGVTSSSNTMDFLQEGMGIVPLDVPSSSTNAVEKSGWNWKTQKKVREH